MLGWDAVREIDWGRHFHAYGVADDTPGELRNLTSKEARIRKGALVHLDNAVFHQQSIYSVTAPAVRVVAGAVGELALERQYRGTLEGVLEFLIDVGWVVSGTKPGTPVPQPSQQELDQLFHDMREEALNVDWGSDPVGWLVQESVRDLRAMAGEIVGAVTPLLDDKNDDLRQKAVAVIVEWGAVDPESSQARAVADIIENRMRRRGNRNRRVEWALALARLGRNVSRWLDDADAGLRACAAFFVDSPQATAVLLTALTHPDEMHSLFVHRNWFASMPRMCDVVRELLRRGLTIEQMLPAVLALIAGLDRIESAWIWRLVMERAFPDGEIKRGTRSGLPERLTGAQRALLMVMLENDSWWNMDQFGREDRATIGLPDDREELRRYLRDAPDAQVDQ